MALTRDARAIGQPYRQVLSAALLDAGYLIETETTSARPYDDVLYDAVYALTEATRLTNQPMRQTCSGGWEPDPDPRAALPIVWDRHPCPGRRRGQRGQHREDSQRAPRLLGSRTGMRGRGVDRGRRRRASAPTPHHTVTVDVWVDNILLDVLDHPDIYDDAYDELDRREHEVPAPDDLDATPPPGSEWLDERDEHGLPAWLDDPEKVSAVEKLTPN